VAWSVPSSAKYRSAVNWASMRFNQDEFVGGQAISALFAAAPTARLACPCGWSGAVNPYKLLLTQRQ